MPFAQSLVLVPINGTDCDNRAVDLALMLARRDRATVVVIYIVVVPQELPLDHEMSEAVSRGEAVLRNAEEFAVATGRDIDVELLQSRAAGSAIVDEAIQRQATAIVMATGLYRRAGAITFGRTTVPYVLKNAPCEVIICRRPPDAR